MKKFYLSLLGLVAVSTLATAQVATVTIPRKASFKKLPAPPLPALKHFKLGSLSASAIGNSGLVNPYASTGRVAANNLPELTYGNLAGVTCYDEQYGGSAPVRVIKGKDGAASMIYTYGRRKYTSSSAIGYNRVVGMSLQYMDFGNPGKDSLNVYPDANFRNVPRTDANFTGSVQSFQTFYNPSLHAISNPDGSTAKEYISSTGWGGKDGTNSLYVMTVKMLSRTLATNKWARNNIIGPDTAVSGYCASATSGGKIYTVSRLLDSLNIKADSAKGSLNAIARVDGLLMVSISSDTGETFSSQYLPYINAQEGITGTKNDGIVIDAKGETVAIAAIVFRRTPEPGQEIVVFKSTQGGAPGSWKYQVIAAALRSDTNNWGFPGASDNGAARTSLTDGAMSCVVGNDGKVHVTYTYGAVVVNETGYSNFSYYPNGGSLGASHIRYWNEDFASGQPASRIADYVDVNRNGKRDIIESTNAGNPGSYGKVTQGGVSMSNLSIDNNGVLYCTYSAIVEGTQANFGQPNQKRDIYVVYSKDNGKSWSNPQNIAPLLFAEDASSGGGSTDEVFPSAIKRVGSDNVLHMTWQSDAFAGLVESTEKYTGSRAYDASVPTNSGNWKLNNIAYVGMPTDKITGQYIEATFPSEACLGTTFNVPFTSPYTGYDASNYFYVQLSKYKAESDSTTLIPNFNPYETGGQGLNVINIGNLASSASNGTISCSIPYGSNITPGKYRIRVRSSVTNYDASVLGLYADGIYYPRVFGQISGEYDIDINGIAPDTITSFRIIGDTNTCIGQPKTFYLIDSNDVLKNSNNINFALVPANAGSMFVRDNHITVVPHKEFIDSAFYVVARSSNACGYSRWLSSPKVHVAGTRLNFNPTTRTLTVIDGNSFAYAWYLNPNDNISDNIIRGARDSSYTITDTTKKGLYEVITSNSLGCKLQFIYSGSIPMPVAAGLITSVEVKEANLATSVNMYPNPATDQTTIELSGIDKSSQVLVINQLGQTVSNEMTSATDKGQSVTLNTAGYAKGMYIVRVVTAGQTISRKLIVQ